MEGQLMNLMPVLQKILPFLVATSFNEIQPPKADQWQIVNDQTERGGASTGRVTDVANGIEFAGVLGSIPGNDGKPVAFSLARIKYRPTSNAKGVRVALSSLTPVTALILVAPPLPERQRPTTTYQKAIVLKGDGEIQTFKASWSEFEATVRGKKAKDAPKLDPTKIDSWALQVTRSSQPGQKRYEPIEFQIRVLIQE